MARKEDPKHEREEQDSVPQGPAYPNLGADDEGNDEFLPGFKSRQEAEDFIRDARSLREDFDKLRDETGEREQRDRETINRLIAGQQAPRHEPARQEPSLDQQLEALPDPVERPEEFKRGLAGLIKSQVETGTQRVTNQSTRQTQLSGLYDRFKTENPDFAPYEEIIEGVARREAQALSANGSNPQDAILADPDGFLSRVKNGVSKRLESYGVKPGGKGKNEGDGDGDPPPNRTDGVSGGSQPASRGNGAAPPSTFAKEMQKMQEETGFF